MVQLFVKGVIFSFSFAVEKHFLIYAAFNKKTLSIRGGLRGERGADALSLRDSTPCRPKGSSLWYFLETQFWPTSLKILLKAPCAYIYTNFEEGGSARRKNATFRSKFSKKCLKMPFLAYFFQNFACGEENLAKIGTKQCFGRDRKINLVDLKKRSTKFSKLF